MALKAKLKKQNGLRGRKADYEFFVRYYFPHYAKNKCGKFQIDAANEVARKQKIESAV